MIRKALFIWIGLISWFILNFCCLCFHFMPFFVSAWLKLGTFIHYAFAVLRLLHIVRLKCARGESTVSSSGTNAERVRFCGKFTVKSSKAMAAPGCGGKTTFPYYRNVGITTGTLQTVPWAIRPEAPAAPTLKQPKSRAIIALAQTVGGQKGRKSAPPMLNSNRWQLAGRAQPTLRQKRSQAETFGQNICRWPKVRTAGELTLLTPEHNMANVAISADRWKTDQIR
uniref:Secreted protein n=1 Tax=Globodera rostochiensis TaxID=31243 RepID=A0A914HNP1_GLORO